MVLWYLVSQALLALLVFSLLLEALYGRERHLPLAPFPLLPRFLSPKLVSSMALVNSMTLVSSMALVSSTALVNSMVLVSSTVLVSSMVLVWCLP